MSFMRDTRRMAAVASAAAGLSLIAAPAGAGASTLSNPAPIATDADPGVATPYPATIPVTGLPGTVTKARVTLHGIGAGNVEDLDIALVGPTGVEAKLMSDVCATETFASATFVFDDLAPTELGAGDCPETGTFKPSDPFAGNDNWIAPGPGLVDLPKSLSVFNGTAPNGNWSLFVVDDDNAFNAPDITGGWTLSLDLRARCAGQLVTDAGTDGPDVITGTPEIDVIAALGGNDTVFGLGGEDVVCGGLGNDRLVGGAGKDRLLGEAGKDRMIGGGGADICIGGPKRDKAKSCAKVKSL
jgi:Ca2+-binding RTX toxin-like protein